jgi:translation initiation factor IF-1
VKWQTALVATAFVIASSAGARAQKRTDVVTLLNGDRMTGEILNLNRGRLELKTDDAGTINIEWDKIASVESSRGFEIETEDGRRLLGSLAGRAGERVTIITGDEGIVSIAMSEITHISPIGASFWARLDGSFDSGFTYSQSSGIAQTTVNTNTVFRRPDFAVQLTGSATLTSRNDDTGRDDRGALELAYARYRGRRWYVSGAGRLDTNESLGLVLRSQIAGMIGQRLVNTNRAQFEVGGGLVVNHEQAVDAEPAENVEGLLALKTSYYTYDRPKTQFDANVQYYPSLSNWGRQRLQVDTAIKRELWKDFFLSLNVYDTFDSEPPQPDSSRNDLGVSLSIGWSY